MFRLFRRFFRPLSRPAALLLAWQHRKTLAMWARSIRDEAQQARAAGRPDVARWKALLPALWHERTAAERGTVQSLTVTEDGRVVPGRTPAASNSPAGASSHGGVVVPADMDADVMVVVG